MDGINEFKELVHKLRDDPNAVMGDVQIILAIRKGTVVKNRRLCIEPNKEDTNQNCNANGCLQCPSVTSSTNITVNGKRLKIPQNLNCKTKNAISLWECNICDKDKKMPFDNKWS